MIISVTKRATSLPSINKIVNYQIRIILSFESYKATLAWCCL